MQIHVYLTFTYYTGLPNFSKIGHPRIRLGRQRQMVHSVSGCTRSVQVKLWELLRMRAIP